MGWDLDDRYTCYVVEIDIMAEPSTLVSMMAG